MADPSLTQTCALNQTTDDQLDAAEYELYRIIALLKIINTYFLGFLDSVEPAMGADEIEVVLHFTETILGIAKSAVDRN